MSEDQRNLIKRIHILQGQLDGIARMIQKEATCIQTLTQLKAIKSGVNNLSEKIVCTHCTHSTTKLDQQELATLLKVLN